MKLMTRNRTTEPVDARTYYGLTVEDDAQCLEPKPHVAHTWDTHLCKGVHERRANPREEIELKLTRRDLEALMAAAQGFADHTRENDGASQAFLDAQAAASKLLRVLS